MRPDDNRICPNYNKFKQQNCNNRKKNISFVDSLMEYVLALHNKTALAIFELIFPFTYHSCLRKIAWESHRYDFNHANSIYTKNN